MKFWNPPAEGEIPTVHFAHFLPSEITHEIKEFEKEHKYRHFIINRNENDEYHRIYCDPIYKPGQCPICDTQFEDLYLKEIEESQLERIE